MDSVTPEKLNYLEVTANKLRKDVIKMLIEAGSGHVAGPLGMADIFAAFYFHILKHDPKKPLWQERDRLILSNGHICPILYAALARSGYFPLEELKTLRKLGTRLQGHPHRTALPGVESTSGPLGSGLSQSCGVALAARLDKAKHHVYCLMSDGEHDEGNTWEAVMFAGKYKLHNLTAIMDRNNIQIDGFTENIMPLEPVKAKYEAFNWHVIEMNGNDMGQIVSAIAEAKAIYEKPTMIIAHNIPGRGVDFMENDYRWHGYFADAPGAPPKAEQPNVALKELRSLQGKD
jgi:transketolase